MHNTRFKLVLSLIAAVISGLILISCGDGNGSSSPSPAVSEFSQTFGGVDDDFGNYFQATPDGGYIVTGETESYGAGNSDLWLIKTNKSGQQQWSRTFGELESDGGSCVLTTMDGGYLVTGYTESYGYGGKDLWIIRTDINGQHLWSRTFGGSDNDRGYCVRTTQDGGYVLAGYTESFGSGNKDVWLIKTDALGQQEWSQAFGGSEDDAGASVQQTQDGGYIITGYTESYGYGGKDVWLIKTNNLGQQQWSRPFGDDLADRGEYVQQTSDRGYIITGYTESYGYGSKDFWAIKTNGSGEQQWSRTFGGPSDDRAFCVQATGDGGFILAGYTESFGVGDKDVWLLKINSVGGQQWNRTFGGISADAAYCLQIDDDGIYVIAGFTESYGAGLADMWLMRTDLTQQ